MSKKAVIFTGAATLIAGVIIGSSGSSATAEPEIKTVTKTETVTEEVEVEVVPQACLDALDDAALIGASASNFATVSADWPNLVVRAAEAGMGMDVTSMEAITSDVEDMTAEYNDITAELTPVVRRFGDNAATCRAAS